MSPRNIDPDHISDRQRRILQRVASGEDWRAAARAEGCSDSYSRVIRTRMKQNPAVARAIAAIREEGMKVSAFGFVQAMAEADSAALFARQHKNPMALVKATELRAKLSGLLVDRIEVASIDLCRAISMAEQRTFGSIDATPAGAAHWLPRIAEEASADDPERGPVEDESAHRVTKSWS